MADPSIPALRASAEQALAANYGHNIFWRPLVTDLLAALTLAEQHYVCEAHAANVDEAGDCPYCRAVHEADRADAAERKLTLAEQERDEALRGWEIASIEGPDIQAERMATKFATERAEAAEARLAVVEPQGPAWQEALERTREYIRTAMRPTSVAAACSEGIYDRAHRSGLQHALNAINAEFEKVIAPPLARGSDTPRERLER